MYKIQNITRGKLILGDLNLVLGAGEIIDLDTYFARSTIETSYNLRCALAPDCNAAAVLQKDEPAAVITDEHWKLIEERLKEHVKSIPAPVQTAPTTDHVVLDRKLDLILDALKNGTVTRPKDTGDTGEDNSTLDADTISDIHARALNKLVKNVEEHVAAKREDKKSDVSGHADELEGLL